MNDDSVNLQSVILTWVIEVDTELVSGPKVFVLEMLFGLMFLKPR